MRSIRICLTISPRYIPLVIFSYLFGEEVNTDEDRKMVSKAPGLGVESMSHVQSGLGELFLESSDTHNTENRVK